MSDAPLPSLWLETTPETAFPPLEAPLDVDVAVVGAGITGITTGVLLKRAGLSVAVLDSKRILRGATGYTTAKVTSGHGLVYAHLEKHFGAEGARTYAEANQSAIARIARFVEEDQIECELEWKANYVYGDSEQDRQSVEDEVAAAQRAGLPASFVEDVPLPYPTGGAFRLDGQAQFHPRKYLLPLAQSIAGDGSHVLELTRVVHVERGEPTRVRTDRGDVTARHVVLASHLPILDRGFFFAKAHPHRSYAVAARIGDGAAPDGMFINTGQPSRSVRTSRDERGPLLLLGGEGHKPGEERNTEQRYRALEAFGSRHFGTTEFPYRWSTQDYIPVDQVPYIGRLTRASKNLWVATGFKKWGMTTGTVAAMIISDAILGRPNAWADLFDAKRIKPRPSAARFVKENASAAKHWIGDRIGKTEGDVLADVARGEGRILKVDGKRTAVYRDDAGALHGLSPVCTHMGCLVAWNSAERSWDCPCHGSRFAPGGRVIQGPATKDLQRRELGRANGSTPAA